jgi:1-acyl-sn-glycerol-3-phosphate acyltransferase
MLAALAGVPVVPVYVEGSGRALPRGAGRPRLSRITVRYGPPLMFDRGKRGAGGKERYQEISDQIMAAIGRLRAEAEQASPAASPAPAVNVNR